MSSSPKIFTLKQVVSSIRKTIEERYQSEYWVKAEMHKLNQYASGHCFPELLQKENGKVVAQIGGSIWKHNFDRINKRFIEVVKEPLKEDTTLLMRVKVSFHETYGISLQIMDIDPNYALGELQRERQETLKKLNQLGVLNQNHQLDFPLVPQRIAVISAASSKGLSDFMQVLKENSYGYQFFTMLFTAYLQGDNAAPTIMQQLERIRKVKHHFDLVVIVRGGGGEVGLSCYNNFELCKAIASYELPILTGIGHSTNLTVAEMVAHRNAITPTELADVLIQGMINFDVPLTEWRKQMRNIVTERILKEKNNLQHLSLTLKSFVQLYTHSKSTGLNRLGHHLQITIYRQLEIERRSQREMRNMIFRESKSFTEKSHRKIDSTLSVLKNEVEKKIGQEKNSVEHLRQKVELLNPQRILERGYSLTTLNGKVLNSNNEAKVGDEIQTLTSSKVIISEIKEIDE